MITLVAPCAIGAEKILSNELRQLEFTPISTAIGRVVFTMERAGTRISDNPLSLDSHNPVIQDSVDEQELRALYQSNYKLRTADRVYLQLATIPCRDFIDLFEGVRAIRWQDWFKRDVRVVVDKVRIKSVFCLPNIQYKVLYTKQCMTVSEKLGDGITS